MCKTEIQIQFDEKYISSAEICRTLSISRPTLFHARRNGLLPGEIKIPGGRLYIWERAAISAYLTAWKNKLDAKRNA
jgi:predicted DNA-binding transcriptional regulator AlpA